MSSPHRYLIFAKKAEKEGFSNVARLFRAVAYAEQAHATNHSVALGLAGGTADNLQAAINGETYEVNEMYPAFKAVAELEEEKGAQKSTHWALQAEKVRAGMYQKAKQAVERKEDLALGSVFIGGECGYTVEGSAPDRCPICGASREKFRKF